MAELKIDRGMVYSKHSTKTRSDIKKFKKYADIQEVKNKAKTLTRKDLKITPNFSFNIFKSKAASNTIRINPITPKNCKEEFRFGGLTEKIENKRLIIIPNPININTDGTPDFLEYKLKKYETIIVNAKRIIKVYVSRTII